MPYLFDKFFGFLSAVMGCACSKLCCDRKNAYKNDENHVNGHVQQPEQQDLSAKVLTSKGSTIDKDSEPTTNKVKKVEDTPHTSSIPSKVKDKNLLYFEPACMN